MKRTTVLWGKIALGALLAPIGVMADSIAPSSVNTTINVAESITINKIVTVTAGAPTTSKVDVYFLADTTGSMYDTIDAVAASASEILSETATLGEVQFGVGEYRDVGDVYEYRLNTGMTADQTAAQDAINMWNASGGGDWYEAQLQALSFIATQTATGWRSGSTKILVWFGDSPGHDPSGSSATTEATATAALVAKNIRVEAIDVGLYGNSLNLEGEALRIATATGGAYYPGIDSSSIVETIKDAIVSVFANYSTVSLDLSAVPAGLTAGVVPANITGTFDRSVERTFTFDVTLTGVSAGMYNFSIPALVDGGTVATESDAIQVNSAPPPNEPPIAVCQNVVVGTDPGVCVATVTASQVDKGSWDPDGDAITPTLSPPGPYRQGETTVTLTVTDPGGLEASCTATITVTDNEPPQITCPGNIVQGTDLGLCSAVVTWTVTSTDNCSLQSLECSPASGSVFPKGTTMVTCTATDAAGNTASCTFTVTVNDMEKPTAACVPTTNPAGVKTPTAGKNPKSGQNPDGFYQLLGTDNCEPPQIFVKDSASDFVAGPFNPGDKVKITQAPTVIPNQSPMDGVIVAHIQLKGDAKVFAVDSSGNESVECNCLVPPKPK